MKLFNINGFSTVSGEDVEHYGIPGQRWHRRRYQNPDGTLTPEGKRRYLRQGSRELNRAARFRNRSERLAERTNTRVTELRSPVVDKNDMASPAPVENRQRALRLIERNRNRVMRLEERARTHMTRAKQFIDEVGNQPYVSIND